MVDLMSGLAGVTAVMGLAKDVKVVVDKVADAEAKILMADLISALADVKMEAAERLSRIAELELQLSLKEEMTYEPPYYWIQKGNDTRDGPFCQSCYDSGQKAIRLQAQDRGTWRCFTCNGFYTDGDYIEPEEPDFAELGSRLNRPSD